ncbi:MAG: adenosylmethionine decarboxylase [Rhabdochlamydiaceae bacterium]|jgi:S-adenosylmethionine decarboxylase
MKRRLFLIFCILGVTFLHADGYQFRGKQFSVNYSECDAEALCNVEALKEAMREGVREAGAHIIEEISHKFPGGDGMTMAIILSESHATIHTYPEHNACFVDLFTCGDHCHYENFDKVLRDYLTPGEVQSIVWIRDKAFTEHSK